MNDTLTPNGSHLGEAVARFLTQASIEAVVLREAYHVFPGTTLTVCCLTLRNGFHVTGESACADPALFNAAKGQEIARADAVQKVWTLEGYLLRQMLHEDAIEAVRAQGVPLKRGDEDWFLKLVCDQVNSPKPPQAADSTATA
jgi:hypothetical protein